MFSPRQSTAHSMGWGVGWGGVNSSSACFYSSSCHNSITETTESTTCLLQQVRLRCFNPSSPPQIVLHREKEVKQTECDMAMVHHLLSRIPPDLPYELLICQAQDLFDQYPPSLLVKRAALQFHKRWVENSCHRGSYFNHLDCHKHYVIPNVLTK